MLLKVTNLWFGYIGVILLAAFFVGGKLAMGIIIVGAVVALAGTILLGLNENNKNKDNNET